MKKQSGYIKELVWKYIQGESSVTDKKELGQWIAHSDENKAEYINLKEEAETSLIESGNEEWTRFLSRYEIDKKPVRRMRFSVFMRYAASIAIILGSAISIYLLQDKGSSKQFEALMTQEDQIDGNQTTLKLADGENVNIEGVHSTIEVSDDGSSILVEKQAKNTQTINKNVQLNKLVVPYGKTANLTLADGTKVWLNAGSRLVFPLAFEKKTREVFLEGEAYFDVHHNEDKPFKVLTKDVKFTVLGTTFNVNAYSDNSKIEAVLVDGSLRVENKLTFSKKQVTLKPGQKSAYNASAKQMWVADVDPSYYTAWKEGYIMMRKSSITSVVERLQRFYHQEVNISEEVLRKNHKITGKLVLTQNKEQAFAALCEITDMKYFVQNDTILLIDRD
ncbi:MAG: FecR domain-containing protein [Marinilabiliaceae bacterium]|nr:FecR domain-containing protein [Marinilabiliaceae bacterium]